LIAVIALIISDGNAKLKLPILLTDVRYSTGAHRWNMLDTFKKKSNLGFMMIIC